MVIMEFCPEKCACSSNYLKNCHDSCVWTITWTHLKYVSVSGLLPKGFGYDEIKY